MGSNDKYAIYVPGVLLVTYTGRNVEKKLYRVEEINSYAIITITRRPVKNVYVSGVPLVQYTEDNVEENYTELKR